MSDQTEKARAFRALHAGPGIFVLANAWDAGSACLLERLGFKALGTTSAGFAFAVGKPDGGPGRDAVLAHCHSLCAATSLPVSADLEDGLAATEDGVAETIRLAADAGLAGASIEDWWSGRDGTPPRLMDADVAAARVAAAVEAARALPFPFTVTARAENFLRGRPDLADTIDRLQRYEAAGADVLYAPALGREDDLRTVLGALERPLNVLMDGPGSGLSVAALGALGVRRVSLGSGLARAALGAFLRAAREVAEEGTFAFRSEAASLEEVTSLLEKA